MRTVPQKIFKFLLGDDGPTASEYAVLLGVIFLVILVSISLFGLETASSFSNSSQSITSATGS